MKRLSAVLAFLVLFSLTSTSPADAIFGLGKCEKVKDQITSLENKMIGYLNDLRGEYHTNNIKGYDVEIFILTTGSVKTIDSLAKLDPIPTIWKFSYNNPKCFSNTQKLRIKELGKLSTANFASYEEAKKYTYSKKCKGADSWVLGNGGFKKNKKRIAECFISDVKVISSYMKYKTIYSY
jgi:hypothetical protein